MPSSYVLLPFGTKIDREGRRIDFDALYLEAIVPALQDAGVDTLRPEDTPPGADWRTAHLRELLSCDLVVADVSVPDDSVRYDLGVRHALRPGGTILISSSTRALPADLMSHRVIPFDVDESGRVTEVGAIAFRSALFAAARALTETAVVTSPVFQIFPDLEVSLPPEMSRRGRARRARGSPAERSFAQQVILAPDQAMSDVVEIEVAVRHDESADPYEYLSLLRKYRDLAEWDRVIRLAEEAPPSVANSIETKRMLALALNRRGSERDRDRAVSIMQTLLEVDPWDGESRGVLGLIRKEQFESAKESGQLWAAKEHLELALAAYREAFRINPADYYAGVNVISLLLEKPDDPEARQEIRELLPQVREAVLDGDSRALGARQIGVRQLSTEMQLAAIAGDWSAAESAAQRIVDQESPDWMVKSAVRDLGQLKVKLRDVGDKQNVAGLAEMLSSAVSRKHVL